MAEQYYQGRWGNMRYCKRWKISKRIRLRLPYSLLAYLCQGFKGDNMPGGVRRLNLRDHGWRASQSPFWAKPQIGIPGVVRPH
jgi:hypothetical protein